MKSYTDLEQSKKLAKILPVESADSHYVRQTHDYMGNTVDGKWSHPKYGNPNSKYANYIVQNFSNYETIPCWSLAALLDILPKVHKLKPILDLEECSIQYSGIDLYVVADNPVDACYEMIINLNGLNLL